MAGENLSYIFSALSQVLMPELHRQWNRTTVFLGELSATPNAITEGMGKNTQFATEFSGATASTVAEGSDVAASEYGSDVDVPATAPWCTYRSSFQLSEQEMDAARSAMGSPDELRNLFGPRILSAGAVIARSNALGAYMASQFSVNGVCSGLLPQFDAVLWPTPAVALVLYVDTGVDGTSSLIYYSADGVGFPLVVDGFNYYIAPNLVYGGWFQV